MITQQKSNSLGNERDKLTSQVVSLTREQETYSSQVAVLTGERVKLTDKIADLTRSARAVVEPDRQSNRRTRWFAGST